MLLIICGKFCCFHMLYILKLGIQHKHEEINWNSELQCRKRAEAESLANFAKVVNFRKAANFRSSYKISQGCEILQATNFHRL